MNPVPVQRPASGHLPALRRRILWALALALSLSAVPAAQAAEASSARQTMGDILDSLTHAPEQQQTATGFPKTPPKSGGPPAQRQAGPSAPAQPKAPVVQTFPARPAGAQPSAPPLPGSAFSGSPGTGGQSREPAPPAPSAMRQGARPAPKAEPRQRENQQREDVLRLEHDGLERLALVLQPKGKALGKGQARPRLPLVIFLHGAGGSARQAMQQTGLAGLAERAGFIAVFPEGLAAPQGQENAGIQTWNAWMCCGYARDQKSDDVGYLAALISRLKTDYPVDPRRIHLAGFSNGAMLASRFALERPGVVAAIASVAGYLPCELALPKEPLPVLVIHGNRDRVARFGPAQDQPRTGRLCEDFPAKAQVDFWVHGLGLKAKPQQVQDARNSRTRVERYGPDKKNGRAAVEFVIVKGGGHAWPGGKDVRYRYCDLPTPDPDATAMLWNFFKRQTRPGAPEKAAPPQKPGKKPSRR
jgi:polyhydroxybutyrate depolymerase